MITVLKKVPIFSGLTDSDLRKLIKRVKKVKLKKGKTLFIEGQKGKTAYVILEGMVEIVKKSGNRDVLLAVRKKGSIIGEIALLDDAPRMASVRAKEDSLLIEINNDQFENLLKNSYSATRSTLHTVIKRWQNTESQLRQSEKMAQLGVLAAGIVHELNNPSAAVQRASEQLNQVALDLRLSKEDFEKLNLKPAVKKVVEKLEKKAIKQAGKPDDLDTITRSDKEEEIEYWLEKMGYSKTWEVAPILARVGFNPNDLIPLAKSLNTKQLQIVVTWLCKNFSFYSLVEELHRGSQQISEIVKALKSYVYLDQAPVQTIDIHDGLDNTLVLLRNKLKEGVKIKRFYGKNIPLIQAHGSELNQVWTNIIDNAIDAMNAKGEITIKTYVKEKQVVVEIQDSGPGIPKKIQPKLFDPFFTTKEVGKGTGLGLDISYNIVVNKHRGDIKVFSKPGKTIFKTILPTKQVD